MKYTKSNLKKYALVTNWGLIENSAGYRRKVYFVAQIVKQNNKKEMTLFEDEIIVNFPSSYKAVDIEPFILKNIENIIKQIDKGEVRIYDGFHFEDHPRIEKFKSIKFMNKIPEIYQKALKQFYKS